MLDIELPLLQVIEPPRAVDDVSCAEAGCAWMTTAASQRWRQRLFGKGLEMVGFVARQHQLQGQTERRVDRQQFAVAAQFQRGQPGRLTRARLTMMPPA